MLLAISACNVEKLGVAWERGYRCHSSEYPQYKLSPPDSVNYLVGYISLAQVIPDPMPGYNILLMQVYAQRSTSKPSVAQLC